MLCKSPRKLIATVLILGKVSKQALKLSYSQVKTKYFIICHLNTGKNRHIPKQSDDSQLPVYADSILQEKFATFNAVCCKEM